MVWDCLSACSTGTLHITEGKIYRDILDKNLLLSTRMMKMKQRCIFQQDNDPKHTTKATLNWFQRKKIKLLKWASQSHDLNPTENLWKEPTNLQEDGLKSVCVQEWTKSHLSNACN